ncbi:MAG: hypothetical protein HYZ16_05440 [Bacteroidetes bacterium]|nr:hypothetical protein [Bacteroidota bacterium]
MIFNPAFAVLFALFLSGCSSSLDKELARRAIRRYFSAQSMATGAGNTAVDSVFIEKMTKQSDGTWKVRARVEGNHSNYSLPHPIENEAVDYTMECTISQDGSLWKVSAVN